MRVSVGVVTVFTALVLIVATIGLYTDGKHDIWTTITVVLLLALVLSSGILNIMQ